MRAFNITFAVGMLMFTQSWAQQVRNTVVTQDIYNFWKAYDQVLQTTDSLKQLDIIQKLYIEKGSAGLKAFMEVKGYTAQGYVSLLRKYPKFWKSIRVGNANIEEVKGLMLPELKRFNALYPALKPASIYFTVGGMRSGGTTQGNKVMIGTELITGTPETDISEFPVRTRDWLKRYFSTYPFKNVVLLNVHEYVHTQQKGPGKTLLGQCLYEGVCDFVAELVTGKTMPLPYMKYGATNEDLLKKDFKAEMFSDNWDQWLYNSNAENGRPGDLGYYIGYSISREYYKKAKDKKLAIAQMIELNYEDREAIEAFLKKSGYYQK